MANNNNLPDYMRDLADVLDNILESVEKYGWSDPKEIADQVYSYCGDELEYNEDDSEMIADKVEDMLVRFLKNQGGRRR